MAKFEDIKVRVSVVTGKINLTYSELTSIIDEACEARLKEADLKRRAEGWVPRHVYDEQVQGLQKELMLVTEGRNTWLRCVTEVAKLVGVTSIVCPDIDRVISAVKMKVVEANDGLRYMLGFLDGATHERARVVRRLLDGRHVSTHCSGWEMFARAGCPLEFHVRFTEAQLTKCLEPERVWIHSPAGPRERSGRIIGLDAAKPKQDRSCGQFTHACDQAYFEIYGDEI